MNLGEDGSLGGKTYINAIPCSEVYQDQIQAEKDSDD